MCGYDLKITKTTLIALVTSEDVRRRVLGTSYARQRVGGMPALAANGRA